ncbi:MAG: hypothetical protein IPG22_09810 [Acidobacteria bacterium]|nr:hypothetical protein [Acidobacteriota bacterium]
MKRESVLAVYDSHEEAEKAVRELQRSGFDMKQLSIVGKDFHTEEHVIGYYNNGDRMKAWGRGGAFWGGLWGLLFGSAFFVIPGIGPVLLAGQIIGWIIAALEGAVVVGGLSALGAGLYGLGIPKNSIIEYEAQIKAGNYVVIAHGPSNQISRIEGVLSNTVHHGIEGHPFLG